MAGLVPAIYVFAVLIKQGADARDISAFTRVFDALCAGMTSKSSSVKNVSSRSD
jgi:hypothetical protein